MGTLVVKRYPTTLFAKAADHTYVECGNGGKGWKCWGGKTGGTALRQGTGSTKQADCIAQPDEKAGIKCYLVNGVCHQAANRILLPASITTRGARGAVLSFAMFGTYGHVGIWPCSSPFNKCPGVSGDLPQCMPTTPSPRVSEAAPALVDQLDWSFVREVRSIYDANAELFAEPPVGILPAPGTYVHPTERVMAFHIALFEHLMEFQLGPLATGDLRNRLREIYQLYLNSRLEAQRNYALQQLSAREYANRFNELTIEFQDQVAKATTDVEYQALFQLGRDERIVLADPAIVEGLG